MKCIDLNCDMGEMPEMLSDGTQEMLMRYITSANIACGGHAGDVGVMRATIQQALRHKIAIGAHPGYEDRANFGRIELQLAPEQISSSVLRQLQALEEIADQCGANIVHVKPHGALYNQAVRDHRIASAVAEGVRRWRHNATVMGLAGSTMLDDFRAAGLAVAAEAFADRRYEPDGRLRSRKFADALLRNPEEAADQALRIVEQGSVIASDGSIVPLVAQTICIHGDTPSSTQIAAAIHHRLGTSGIKVKPLNFS